MKPSTCFGCFGFQCKQLALVFFLAALIATAQTNSSSQLPLEIISYKIGTDYYPMLDSKPSTMTADNPDFPRPPGEVAMRQNRRGGLGERNEQIKSRGKSRTMIQVISDAQWVKFTVKNSSAQAIKSIVWDFAFPRYNEQGELLLRQSVNSQDAIKPGGKRTLKFQLPVGATRCKAINVVASSDQTENAMAQESVCGAGFNDPTKLKQSTVTVQRIEYVDGTSWQRP